MKDQPLRILTVANVPANPDSGAAGTVFHTNLALRERGHQVDEIWGPDLGVPRIRHGNLHAWLEQPRRYLAAVRAAVPRARYDVVMISQPQAWLAARWLRRNRFPGVVVNRSHGLELRVFDILPEWHRRFGVPEARFPHSLLSPWLRNRLVRQWDLAIQHADRVVVGANADVEYLAARYPRHAAKLACVHHGVSQVFLDPPPPPLTPGRLRRLLYVGQHAFIKGYPVLLRTLELVLREHPEASFTWVTSRSAHDGLRAALSPEIAGRVAFLDWRPNAELPRLLDEHGIFLFPSFYEGYGKAPLEAIARGMWLVSSDTGAMREYVPGPCGGRLCPVGDAAAMAAGVHAALADPVLAAEQAAGGPVYARTKSWQACAQGLEAVFRQALANPAGNPPVGP